MTLEMVLRSSINKDSKLHAKKSVDSSKLSCKLAISMAGSPSTTKVFPGNTVLLNVIQYYLDQNSSVSDSDKASVSSYEINIMSNQYSGEELAQLSVYDLGLCG